MEIWIAVLIETLDTDPPKLTEPVAIEVFLSEEECWQYTRTDKMTDKAREMGVMETGVYYMLSCEPLNEKTPPAQPIS